MFAELVDHTAPGPVAFAIEPYGFWPKVACWTPEEAASLSLGLEPTTLAPTIPPEWNGRTRFCTGSANY